MAKVKLTLVKSIYGQLPQNRRIIKALGLKRINHSREFEKTKELAGAIRKIGFMIKVEEI
jgi:large subunit ribosomal protein L30